MCTNFRCGPISKCTFWRDIGRSAIGDFTRSFGHFRGFLFRFFFFSFDFLWLFGIFFRFFSVRSIWGGNLSVVWEWILWFTTNFKGFWHGFSSMLDAIIVVFRSFSKQFWSCSWRTKLASDSFRELFKLKVSVISRGLCQKTKPIEFFRKCPAIAAVYPAMVHELSWNLAIDFETKLSVFQRRKFVLLNFVWNDQVMFESKGRIWFWRKKHRETNKNWNRKKTRENLKEKLEKRCKKCVVRWNPKWELK